MTVRHLEDGTVCVTEGPFASGEESLGGYVVVNAASREEAVEIAMSWPTEETIEVRPVWMPS